MKARAESRGGQDSGVGEKERKRKKLWTMFKKTSKLKGCGKLSIIWIDCGVCCPGCSRILTEFVRINTADPVR